MNKPDPSSSSSGSEPPFGRAVVHRPTGRIVGPIAQIYPEDWPFRTIPDTETLWRYLDFSKFEDLLRSSSLYFARPDRFEDSFEGRFSPGNKTAQSKSDQAFHELYRFKHTQPEDYIEVHRNVVFINCWHRNTREDIAMWRAYTSSPESVVVTTSGKATRTLLPERILKSAVTYAPLGVPRTEFSHNSLFFYKPSEYGFEREFRLLRPPEVNETFYSEEPDDRFRRVSVPINRFIHRVITHPRASSTFKREVERLMKTFLARRLRHDSALEI